MRLFFDMNAVNFLEKQNKEFDYRFLYLNGLHVELTKASPANSETTKKVFYPAFRKHGQYLQRKPNLISDIIKILSKNIGNKSLRKRKMALEKKSVQKME